MPLVKRPLPRWLTASLCVATFWLSGFAMDVLVFGPRGSRPLSPNLTGPLHWPLFWIEYALSWVYDPARTERPTIRLNDVVRFLYVASIPFLVGLLVYRRLGGWRRDKQYLHCPRCWHILKGLTEARCTECGQRI
ncbi:MAG: hypothetical protein ACE5I3_13800 [Phycisphaerae bacterium]